MKRLPYFVAAVALAGGLAVGCSKGTDVPSAANIDTNKITNDAAKCTEMATSYAALFTPLATGGTDADKEKVATAVNDMKAKVPAKVQTDLDTIGNGIKNAKTPTDVAKFMSSTEYTTANTNVTKYLTTECAKIGS
jgi:hypothetical protein